jgi:hypothetical protein
VLLAHLRENDLHARLNFIDKALAVAEARHLFEAELGEGPLSQRRLESLLRRRGYGLSHGLISQMGYAVARLLPAMPQALEAGLGRPQVERLRALDKAACALWQHYGLGDETAFGAMFAELCRRHDGPDWDLAPLRAALESALAQRAELSLHTVRAQLAARLAGATLAVPSTEDATPEVPRVDAPTGRVDPVPNPGDKAIPIASIRPEAQGEDEALAGDWEAGEGIDTREETGDLDEADGDASPNGPDGLSGCSARRPGAQADDADGGTAWLASDGQALPTDLKSLRARAWTLAARLAQRHGIGELVEPFPSQGLGFVLRDVPDPALAEQLDEETLGRLSLLWWHLAACAEMTVAPPELVLATLNTDSVLGRALETGDAGLLFASVWTLDPGQAGHRLWRLLDERDWQDLLGLMTTYRALHRVADASHTALWS